MNPLKVLSTQEVESIHHATLRVLSQVGVVLPHDRIRKQLMEAGATLKDERILLPPEMVEKALASCAKNVTTVGRNGQEIVLGDGSLHWHNLGGARDIYDPKSGQARHATLQDVRDSTRSVSYTHLTLPTTGSLCRYRWSPYH